MLATNYLSNPALISDICGVSRRQARRYVETGTAPEPVRRLMALYQSGRVLNDHWSQWRIYDDRIISLDSPREVWHTPPDLWAWWFERQELETLRRDRQRAAQYVLF